MTIREKLKRIPLLKMSVFLWRSLSNRHGFTEKSFFLIRFFREYRTYTQMSQNTNFKLSLTDVYPQLLDNTTTTMIDPVYFFQDAWCAKKIFSGKPKSHVDVASKADMVGIISQFTPTTMVDIRPIGLQLPGLSFIKGSILDMPFPDNTVESLSSICVIEHIGLGRYGDPLDPFGSEKAATELSRVLAPGGSLYVSVPVDTENKVYFNAHRAFTHDYVISLFPELSLVEEKYIYGKELFDSYDSAKGFGTGLFYFRK